MQKSLRCKDSRLGFGILILFGISLARKSAAEQLEVRHGAGVGFSGIFNEPLSLRVKQGVVTAVGVFVDFAVPYACKASGTGQSFAETADAGEHVNKTNGLSASLPNKKARIACHLCGKHCRRLNLWFGLVTALPHGSGCLQAQAAAGQAARHSVPAAASRRHRGRSWFRPYAGHSAAGRCGSLS